MLLISAGSMGKHSASSGRHRGGRPKAWARRHWDAEKRAQAAQLDLVEPSWAVMYGVFVRRFYAFARLPIPSGLIVEADDVEELKTRMREEEAVLVFQLRRAS